MIVSDSSITLVDKSVAPNRNMNYPQVPGLIQAYVFVYMYVFKRGSWWIFSDSFFTLAQWIRSVD